MLGILFIYWIWKGFSNLAVEYGKNKWKYFFIGIGSYYAGSAMGGVLIAVVLGVINGFDTLTDEVFENAGWTFFFVLFGGLVCYGVYKFLENKLAKEKELNQIEGIENIGLTEEN